MYNVHAHVTIAIHVHVYVAIAKGGVFKQFVTRSEYSGILVFRPTQVAGLSRWLDCRVSVHWNLSTYMYGLLNCVL